MSDDGDTVGPIGRRALLTGLASAPFLAAMPAAGHDFAAEPVSSDAVLLDGMFAKAFAERSDAPWS